MLEVIILVLEIMGEETHPLGLEINWHKTKIQTTDPTQTHLSKVTSAGNEVEVVEAFTYLGCRMDNTGTSETEVLRRIGIARESFF